MRIQLASDLHLEFLEEQFPGERVIQPAAEADLLALVGDVATGTEGMRRFADWPVPVLYVIGNHECYGRSYEQLRAELQRQSVSTSVVVLDNEAADLRRFTHWWSQRRDELQHLRFLGSTLWTDYRLQEPRLDQAEAMRIAARRLNDHWRIRFGGAAFAPDDALREHQASRQWLKEQLDEPFDGKTVVLTHHAPHRGSLHPRYIDDDLSPAFVSHLPDLVSRADLWVHGHSHDSFDYTVERCRVVANPLGYPRNIFRARKASELAFENTQFRHALVLDI